MTTAKNYYGLNLLTSVLTRNPAQAVLDSHEYNHPEILLSCNQATILVLIGGAGPEGIVGRKGVSVVIPGERLYIKNLAWKEPDWDTGYEAVNLIHLGVTPLLEDLFWGHLNPDETRTMPVWFRKIVEDWPQEQPNKGLVGNPSLMESIDPKVGLRNTGGTEDQNDDNYHS